MRISVILKLIHRIDNERTCSKKILENVSNIGIKQHVWLDSCRNHLIVRDCGINHYVINKNLLELFYSTNVWMITKGVQGNLHALYPMYCYLCTVSGFTERIRLDIHTLGCHWRNSDYCSLHWNTTGGTVTVHTHPAHTVTKSSIHASLRWQDGGTPSSKWAGLCTCNFYCGFTALYWIPVLLLKRVSASTPLSACLGYEHHFSFCVFGVAVQMKSAKRKQLTIPVVYIKCCILGSDLTEWPLNHVLSVHWETTGQTTETALADAISQWSSSGNPEIIICITGTH